MISITVARVFFVLLAMWQVAGMLPALRWTAPILPGQWAMLGVKLTVFGVCVLALWGLGRMRKAI